ncbi:hypothetical protein LTR36_002906 [Oleoguttula mirabilis]|uniref:Rhodopsin domain-containing protein n=1 Tax=Oleoguttula mirabilis TaxID=1507867 RepID=A0AAV9JK61_9PEZI|nr:hypothetical protein LTR36_002906 [Oleoguttula mirabilis]
MRFPPLAILKEWPKANYTDPTVHGDALLVVNIIFITLVCVAVAGRLYSRIVVKQWYGADDTMIVLALLFTIGMTVVVVLANEVYGWNRHLWDLTLIMIPAAGKIAFVAKLMFTLAATFTRLSLICFYYRLVKDSGMRWFNWILHASVLWTVAVCISFVCETIWLCTPIQAYWVYPPMYPSHCLDEGKVMLGGGVINCFSDLLTTVLPIPIIMRLQMPLKQRIGVCVLLCLGLIVTIAGVVRTFFIWKSLMDSYDETWYSYPLWIAAAVEIDLAVICACAPAWKSLLRQPLLNLSSRMSSKLSSLRSPSNSRGTPEGTPDSSAHGRAAIFRPLRSLPWFQVTRLDFERERSSSSGQSSHDIEKGSREPFELPADGHQIESDGGFGSRDFRHSEVALDDVMPIRPPSTPTLRIMKRQSVEQESEHVSNLTPSPRRSIGALLPGQWIGEASAKKLLPRR